MPENDYLPLQMNVIFYETPSFNISVNGIKNSMTIRNTSLVLYSNCGYIISGYDRVLSIEKMSEKITHQITMDKVSWCGREAHVSNSNILNLQFLTPHLLQARSLPASGHLHIEMTDIFLQYDSQYEILPQTSLSFLNFVNIENITMSGTNYFAASNGGSFLNAVSSNLIVTGNLTVIGGDGIQGGGDQARKIHFISDGTS